MTITSTDHRVGNFYILQPLSPKPATAFGVDHVNLEASRGCDLSIVDLVSFEGMVYPSCPPYNDQKLICGMWSETQSMILTCVGKRDERGKISFPIRPQF